MTELVNERDKRVEYSSENPFASEWNEKNETKVRILSSISPFPLSPFFWYFYLSEYDDFIVPDLDSVKDTYFWWYYAYCFG